MLVFTPTVRIGLSCDGRQKTLSPVNYLQTVHFRAYVPFVAAQNVTNGAKTRVLLYGENILGGRHLCLDAGTKCPRPETVRAALSSDSTASQSAGGGNCTETRCETSHETVECTNDMMSRRSDRARNRSKKKNASRMVATLDGPEFLRRRTVDSVCATSRTRPRRCRVCVQHMFSNVTVNGGARRADESRSDDRAKTRPADSSSPHRSLIRLSVSLSLSV